MKYKFYILMLIVILSAWMGMIDCSGSKSAGPADMVLVNGKIVTVDNDWSIAEAVAVKGRRIIGVGSDRAMKKLAASGTRVIDLKGRCVLPGLIEGHNHMLSAAWRAMERTDDGFVRKEIPSMNTIADVLSYVESEARRLPEGEWIEVLRVFPTRLVERRMPTREELDRAAPNHPVVFHGGGGGVINSAALRKCKIGRYPQQPKTGTLVVDADGYPTGLIRSAWSALEPGGWPLPVAFEDKLAALQEIQRQYIKYGFTSTFERACSIEDYQVYQTLYDKDQLIMRSNLTMMIPTDRLLVKNDPEKTRRKIQSYIDDLEPFRAASDEVLKVNTLKVFTDGGILTGTALMRKPWGIQQIYQITDPDYRGIQRTPTDVIQLVVDEANRRGWQFTSHAAGDGGVEVLLDAYQVSNDSVGELNGRRFQITHGDFFGIDQIARAGRLGVIADAQWAWLYLDGPMISEILEPERVDDFMPFRAWVEGGLVVAGGSDHMINFDPIKSINCYHPFLGIWCMVTGKMRNGESLGPAHQVSREQALKMYTINNAYMSFEEDLKGSIEKGKLADLVVLSDDILACEVDRIRQIRVLLTMIDGRVVYRDSI